MRNHLLDNAKYILIFLVIFGHIIEPLIKEQAIIKTIYLFIYSFHIPAFVLISGMLSKDNLNHTQLMKTIKSILIPFMLFNLLYEAFYFISTGNISDYIANLSPYWMLWFLYSLFIWKICLPIILNFKYPVFIALIIALGAGYFDTLGYSLGLSRTIYFFPFFILGYKLTPNIFSSIKKQFNPHLITALSLSILVLNMTFFLYFHEMQYQWLYGSYGYASLGTTGFIAAGTRFSFYFISFITVMSVLFLIPDTKYRWLIGGKNSLHVYVWHGFFIKIFSALGIVYMIGKLPLALTLFILFTISVILTKLLSTDFIANNTLRFILNPIQKKLLINK